MPQHSNNGPQEDQPQLPKPYNLIDTEELSGERLAQLQKVIQRPLLNPLKGRNGSLLADPASKANALSKYMWVGILDDLVDSKIANNTFNSGGFRNGANRIDKTRDYFGKYLSETWMDEAIDFVNLVHEVPINGVSERDAKGKIRVTDYYEDSYRYVLASLIERMRDYYAHELGIKRNSTDGKKMGNALCDLWYGVAHRVGLSQRPATLEDHEAFVKAHEAIIVPEMDADPKLQKKIQGMARSFMPRVAELSGCSEADVAQLINDLRPDLSRFLKPELDRMLDPKNKAPEPPSKGIFGKVWNVTGAVASMVSERIRQEIMGTPKMDPTLQALKRAGNQNHDTSIRAIYHMARYLPDMHFDRVVMPLEPHQALIEENKPGDFMYVVLNTTAPLAVVRAGGDSKEIPVSTIEKDKPALLGEVGILRGTTTETVRAGDEKTYVDVVRIPKEQFQDIMKLDESIWVKHTLFPKVAERLRKNNLAIKELQSQKDPESPHDTALEQITVDLRKLSGGGKRETLGQSANDLQERILTYLRDAPEVDDKMADQLVSVLWNLHMPKAMGTLQHQQPGQDQQAGVPDR